VAVTPVLLWGCIGPIDYLNTVARKARRAVAEAKAVNSEKLSPYEYWSAVTYLRMAREKAAHADYEDANKYGAKAVEMGELAKKLAAEKGAEGPNAIQTPPEDIPAVVVEPKPAGEGQGQP
jgi:hypothetical protein